MTSDLDRLRAAIVAADAPITVERIRNDVSRQTRFVVFDRETGDKLTEGRHEVTSAWIAGYLESRAAMLRQFPELKTALRLEKRIHEKA